MPAEMAAAVGGGHGGNDPTPTVASPVGYDEVYFGSVPVHLVRDGCATSLCGTGHFVCACSLS